MRMPTVCLRSRAHGAVRAYAHDDHYLTRSKFHSLLTEMITTQTYKYICTLYAIIKPLSVSHVYDIRGSLRLAPNYSLACTNYLR